jgi:hypothetical protein
MISFVLGVGENGGEVGFSCELGSQSCQHPMVTLHLQCNWGNHLAERERERETKTEV